MIPSAGTKLEMLRREKNMTQKEVADYLGVSRNTLAAYESGKSKIPLSVFIRLTDLYKCNVFDVLGVYAPNIEFDVPAEELVKAQAKYKVLEEKAKDDLFSKDGFSESYYAHRYKIHFEEAMLCYKTGKYKQR